MPLPIMLEDIADKNHPNPLVVSPDVGGVLGARATAKHSDDSDLAIIDKRRPRPNEAEVMNMIGEVENRHCIIVDDMVDTGGTLCQGAFALKERGAATVTAYCTHPVLSGKALETIEQSMLDELVVTDTIPLSEAARKIKKIRQLSISELLAKTIYRVIHKESVSSMFLD